MQLNDWLRRLERLHFKSIDMGLERIQAVARRLDLLAGTPFLFTVAGTNGKGSTVTLIDQVLRDSGYKTGLYTSPHLVYFNERVSINGTLCTDSELITAFEAVEAGRGDISLTYFEFTTLAAIWLFKQQQLDAWILEVGLGGRLDAVNIWDADVAVVTSIDIDHQAWLGNDRATIGMEKIGIGRRERPLVMGEPDPPAAVIDRARELGVNLYCQGRDFRYQQEASGWSISLRTPANATLNFGGLPIPGLYLQNAATALQAVALSPFTPVMPHLAQSLQRVTLTGRKQIVHQQPDVMLDVGHNPHAARALSAHLQAQQYGKVHCVVGMLSDKDSTDTLISLLPVVDHWYPVELSCERAMPSVNLYSQLIEMGACATMPRQKAAAACAKLMNSVSNNDLILVFGSFYTVADVIQYGRQLNIIKG